MRLFAFSLPAMCDPIETDRQSTVGFLSFHQVRITILAFQLMDITTMYKAYQLMAIR